MRIAFRAVLPAALLFAAPLLAMGKAQPEPWPLPERVRSGLAEVDRLLGNREWEPARNRLQGLLAAEIAGNDQLSNAVGACVSRLAVAEAGLGSSEDAAWHWRMADHFDGSTLSARELAQYGAPGEQLAKIHRREPGAAPAGLKVHPLGGEAGLQPPRRTAGEALDLRRLQTGSPPLWMQVELIIDAEGRVREPVVLAANSPYLAFEVLQAVRTWRYEPARREGQPVAVFLELTVNSPKGEPLEKMVTLSGEMATIDRLLREQKWKAARNRSEKLWRQALNNAEQTPQAFALLLTLRAIAEAGEAGAGSEAFDRALCFWQAAQGLEPQLFHAGLAGYGAPGRLLEGYRWQAPRRKAGTPEHNPELPATSEEVTPPRPVSRLQPIFPEIRRQQREQGSVIVVSLIDATGAIRLPFPLPEDMGKKPNFSASAVDALCRSRFQPASYQGKPVPTVYSLTVNFEIQPAGL